jgi:HEAT repeat protein
LDSDGHSGWRTSEKAATELEKLSPDEIAQLWPLLKDSQVEVRRGAAVFLLSQFNPADSDQRTAFLTLLDDHDPMIRARSLDAVRQFSRDDQLAALPRLSTMLDAAREPRPENRIAILRLYGSLKADARPALTSIQKAGLSDPDAKVRAAAIAAATNVAEPREAPDYLKKALEDKDSAVRLVAAARLRQLGPAAATAAGELAKALADSKSEVAEAAGEALIQIGAPAVNPLIEQLSSKSVAARKLALMCLTKLGPAAKSAKSAVEKCKQDADPQVRQLAEAALKILAAQ